MVLAEYEDENGRSPFGLWFASLDASAAAKVAVALSKVERGALSNVKPVGEGVSEYRSISVPAIASISAATVRPSSFF